MKFSETWLREWVNPPDSTEELAEKLTMAGLEVDAVEPAGGSFDGVVIGEVQSVEPHPDADKLRVCTVDVGGPEPLSIVCGAANVRPGLRAPTARIGARLSEDFKIKKTKLRGVASEGMLCSASELGLAESSEGLMELPQDAPVGGDVRDYLGLEDHVLALDLTPNRSDCLGIAGIAREVGLLTGTAVQQPAFAPVAHSIDDQVPVTLEASEACPRYLGRVVRGINANAPTPLWMQERLRRSGLRSLGPLVDVTNYVLLELGQPMHAFDLAQLEGGIRVRFAAPDESLTLLDERRLSLDPQTLVIADQSRALALAGIMGGAGSGIGPATCDVFLECAFFTPRFIAGRARSYGLQTDSSYRFERGVDPEQQSRAMERATRLLLEIAGGEPGPVTEASAPAHLPARKPVRLRADRLQRLLGCRVPDAEVEVILRGLGSTVETGTDGWQVTAPSFRFDLEIEADWVEEVGRVYGYHRIPSQPPRGSLTIEPRPEGRVSPSRLRTVLADRGYQEVVTYTFVDPAEQRLLDPERTPLGLANPLSAEMAVMRTTLWPGLIATLVHNLHRQQERVRIFEYGLSFIPEGNEIIQRNRIAGLIYGPVEPEHWSGAGRCADFFDGKGDVEALLALSGAPDQWSFESAPHPALHPGQSARLQRAGRTLGWVGTLHPEVQKKLELSDPPVLFELDGAGLAEAAVPAFRPLSKFPSIRRDLAVVVDEQVSAAQVAACVGRAIPALLQELRLFDVYRGKGVDSGRKSLALGLILQDSSRTLTDEEVDAAIDRVVGELQKQLGAGLRD